MDEVRQQIEANLTALYGGDETDEKSVHRQRVISPTGEINKFQVTALAGMVRRRQEEQASARPDELVDGPVVGASALPETPPELIDDVPEPEEGYGDRPNLVQPIKSVLDIEGAVRRWGKPQALKIGSRTEGIHVRCPFPAHIDNNPSAWINTTKNTWFCGACQEGGDQIDFYAAARHGYSADNFHRSSEFREILVEICGELGIDPEPPAPPLHHVDPELDPVPPDTSDTSDTSSAIPLGVSIDQMTAGIDLDNLAWNTQDSSDPLLHEQGTPTYDWKNLDIPPGTFLHDWMTANTADLGWIAPEFFMMLGLQAVGLACGHHQYSRTRGMTTTGTMGIILVGPSGSGKSTAAKRLTKMFNKVTGSRWDWELGTGIKVFNTPASSEALIAAIHNEVEDPADPSIMHESQTTAFMYDDEFATFVSKTKRKGGEHMKQRLIELYDFSKSESGPELSVTDITVTRGTARLHDSFFSACFCTQTDVLRRQVEDHDMLSGFMNRLIPVFGVPLRAEDPDDDVDDDPQYLRSWDQLWRRLRSMPQRSVLPVSQAAKDLLRRDSYMKMLINFGNMDDMSLLARLKQHMHEVAFLLAVNEGVPEIGTRHYEIALHLAKNYMQACYAKFFAAAKATQTKDIAERILAWVHDFYDRAGVWPNWHDLTKQRFWKNATEFERDIALKALQVSQHVAKIQLRNQRGIPRAILVATDREDIWSRSYSGVWDKIFQEENFYANV